jgi:hypothetical protein
MRHSGTNRHEVEIFVEKVRWFQMTGLEQAESTADWPRPA